MISAERWSNKYKNEVTKKILIACRYYFEFKKKKLSIELTPQERIELEVIHILIERTLHVSSKENGAHF